MCVLRQAVVTHAINVSCHALHVVNEVECLLCVQHINT